jgi:hypothetical protein
MNKTGYTANMRILNKLTVHDIATELSVPSVV